MKLHNKGKYCNSSFILEVVDMLRKVERCFGGLQWSEGKVKMQPTTAASLSKYQLRWLRCFSSYQARHRNRTFTPTPALIRTPTPTPSRQLQEKEESRSRSNTVASSSQQRSRSRFRMFHSSSRSRLLLQLHGERTTHKEQ